MPQSAYDVVGVGNAIVDIIARCDEAFLSNQGMEKGFMQLIDASREHLAAFKLPRRVIFVDEIVRAPSGKADYRWAKGRALEALAADA